MQSAHCEWCLPISQGEQAQRPLPGGATYYDEGIIGKMLEGQVNGKSKFNSTKAASISNYFTNIAYLRSLVVGQYTRPFTKATIRVEISYSAQLTGVDDPDTYIATGNEIRAPGIDVWVPAQKLVHGEGILALGDDVPACISVLHFIKLVAWTQSVRLCMTEAISGSTNNEEHSRLEDRSFFPCLVLRGQTGLETRVLARQQPGCMSGSWRRLIDWQEVTRKRGVKWPINNEDFGGRATYHGLLLWLPLYLKA